MENNGKFFNFNFLMIFYFLLHEERGNTYTQQLLAKSNTNCGNYKQNNYEQ